MSVLTYNGIQLGPYWSTQDVSFDPVRDPTGDVDVLFTRCTIRGTAVISQPLLPSIGAETPAQTVARINHLLNIDRRPLSFVVGGQTLVAVPTGLDAKNGPRSLGCRVDRIQGDKAFAFHVAFETHLVDCPENALGPAWLSNRWSDTADINRLGMAKRIRTGTIIFRSDLRVNPDAFRGLITPPLEPEWLRLSANYTLAPDGLALQYRFEDEEQYLMPPDPAGEAEGSYYESTQEGAIRYGEVQLMLKGGKPTDKGGLLARCISVAMAKIDLAGVQQNDRKQYLAQCSIRENMYRNEVEVRIRAMLRQLKQKTQNINVDLSRFTKFPLGSRPGEFVGFDPGTYGPAQLSMIAAALQDPCLRQNVLTSSPQLPNQPILRSNNTPAQVSISPIDFDGRSTLRADGNGLYTRYEIRARDELDEHTLQLPVGKKNAKASIIKTAESTQRRVYEWTAEKIGEKPKIPKAEVSENSNAVLLERHLDPGQVEVMPDGDSLKYVASGRYEYAFKDRTKVKLAAAVPPWMELETQLHARDPFEFSTGIIDVGGDGFTGSFSTLENP